MFDQGFITESMWGTFLLAEGQAFEMTSAERKIFVEEIRDMMSEQYVQFAETGREKMREMIKEEYSAIHQCPLSQDHLDHHAFLGRVMRFCDKSGNAMINGIVLSLVAVTMTAIGIGLAVMGKLHLVKV